MLHVIISGSTYNGECISTRNDLQDDGTIATHHSRYDYYESSHVQDCYNFCLTHNPQQPASQDMTETEGRETNRTVEETTG